MAPTSTAVVQRRVNVAQRRLTRSSPHRAAAGAAWARGRHELRPAARLSARDLGKTYQVAQKDPGRFGTLRHFVRRRTRDILAATGVSFEIERGEFVGFVGTNRAGKTTTLKMLSGLIRPTSGEVRVAGQDPFRRDPSLPRPITLVMGQKQPLIGDLPHPG